MATTGDFEGIILIKQINEGAASQQQWFVKGDRLRFEEIGPEADHGAMIFDAKKKVMYNVQHDEKFYLELPAGQTTKAAQAMEDIVVTKTGKSDKVAGYSCEIYHTRDKSDGSTGEVCVARGLGNAAIFGLTGAEAGRSSILPSWMREMLKDGGFPIKGVDRDEHGKEESRWEAVKIETKRLDDRLFLPPAGYQRRDLGAAMKQFGDAMNEGQSKRNK